MMAKLSLLALTLMVAPAAVQAQGGAGAQGTTSGQTPGTPQARIDAALQAAAKASVPTSLLQSKIDEGAAKRVPLERVATAVENRLHSLVRAAEALRDARINTVSTGELAVAADALQAGVSENALITITRTATPERRVVAVAVLADLVRLGQNSEPALARVTNALISNTALANLQAEVASQLRLGGLTSTLDAAGILRIGK